MPDMNMPEIAASQPNTQAVNTQALNNQALNKNLAINISDAATARIAAILSRESKPDMKLRIAVAGGGCSGFQYHFTFDSDVTGDDHIFQRQHHQGTAAIVIDESSLGLLGGSEIDFVEDLSGSSFQIKNPQAKSGCGCGNSFSL